MNCDQNCAECPFAAVEAAETKPIVVYVVGDALPDDGLGFGNSPVRSFSHRGYTVRLVNFSGEFYHIGRRIIAGRPDIVLNLVDSMNLETGLQLTSKLIDMDSRIVLALGRYDELLATDHSLDISTLGALFGFPALVFGGGREDLARLLSTIVETYEKPFNLKKHVHVPFGADIDEAISRITPLVAQSPALSTAYHDRYIAVQLLEDPDYMSQVIQTDPMGSRISEAALHETKKLAREFGLPVSELVLKAREGFVAGALQETLHHSKDSSDHTLTQKIDAILTNRWLGLPIMVLVLFGVFEATFALGAYPQVWIESGIGMLAEWLKTAMAPTWFSSLLTDGVVQGVGSVLAFLPNIVILFLFLSILEDSGYMARAAFTMDKLMHRIGLHGRSFIPMLIGFGCNVPAIMSARSIEDRKDRALTMLMIPFMSCSARLPVYLLFIGAFFARYKALMLLLIYTLAIVFSIVFAFIMKRTKYFRKDNEDYVSELPDFRMPTLRNTGAHIWERVSDYLKKISSVILLASIIIWALEYFPADRTQGGLLKEESCLADIGKAMEPVMAPLGFDWKMNVCLLTGLPAKEAIVSTMGILYHTDDDASLAEVLREESGVTPVAALAFMLFAMLYFPCVATVNALKREIGWKWAAFTVVHSLLLAWVASFLVFNIGSLIFS